MKQLKIGSGMKNFLYYFWIGLAAYFILGDYICIFDKLTIFFINITDINILTDNTYYVALVLILHIMPIIFTWVLRKWFADRNAKLLVMALVASVKSHKDSTINVHIETQKTVVYTELFKNILGSDSINEIEGDAEEYSANKPFPNIYKHYWLLPCLILRSYNQIWIKLTKKLKMN